MTRLDWRNFSILALLTLGLYACKPTTASPPAPIERGPLGAENLAFRWCKVALEATADDTDRFRPRPTVTSRMLALVFTSIFDAWTRFTPKAEPIILQSVPRRPTSDQTQHNKEIAISHAAYHSLKEYFFSDSTKFRNFMLELKLNPDDNSLNPNTPVGIGNLAAHQVIQTRHHDGSNQYGDSKGAEGTPYGDYTAYKPVNTADDLINLQRWQPKYFSDGKGGKWAPNCLTPHWGRVKPLLLDSGSQFRAPAPPDINSQHLRDEVRQVIDFSANLTNEQKALVEFMRDGPKSVQQAGHWLMFAQHISLRDNHDLDQDVKMYFLVAAAAMDAFIACWETKLYYDFARPYALTHAFYKDQVIEAWGGPFKGTIKMKGQDWIPYSPETFVCPPFPSYVSGHSTVSGACAEVLRLYTGSDTFGLQVRRLPGALTELGITTDSVTLSFPTLTGTAEQAGISRVLGGYHIQSENIEGLRMGRSVAQVIWTKYRTHLGE